MSIETLPPEAEIRRQDEPREASNKGINIALVLTLAFSMMLVICAIFSVRHSDYSEVNRPENLGASAAPPVNTTAIAPGTLGPNVLPKDQKPEPKTDNDMGGQALQSDVISPLGPGGFPKTDKEATNQVVK